MPSASRDSGDPASQDSAHFDGNDPYALIDDDESTTESTGLLGPSSNGASSRAVANSNWAGFDDFAGLPWYKVPSVYWLVPPYFLFAMAFGGSIVPKLNLIIDLVCNKYFDDRAALDSNFTFTPVVLLGENPQCQIPEVQKAVAKFTLVLNVIIGTLSALTAPKFGSLSDRYGRKRLLVIASAGGVVAEVVTILAARFPDVIPYKWMLAGAVFDGLSGSFTTGTVLSHSYTSDCTPPSKRSVAIGYLQACLFSGLAFGPLLAAYFIRWTGSILSIFYVTLGCHLLFIFFILLVTPESLSQKRQKLAREKYAEEQAANREVGWFARLMGGNANPLEPLRILAPSGPEHKALRRNFLAFAICDFIILGCALVAGGIILLYSELMFGWGNFETGRFISLVSGVRVLVLMVFFPIISWWFRTRPMKLRREKAAAALQAQLQASGSGEAEPLVEANHHDALQLETNTGADNLDVWLLRLALLSDILGTVGYLFARTPTFFVATAVVTAFGGIASATIQSSLTKHVPAQSVGQLLGAMGVLHAIARVIAPILFNGLYAATVKTFPQAFFVLLVSLFGLAGVASLFVKPHVYMKEGQDSASQRSSSPSFHPAAPIVETLDDEELLPA